MFGKRPLFVLVAVLLVLTQVLAACGATAMPTTVPTKAPATTVATAAPTTVPATAKPTTQPTVSATATAAPAVGGTLMYVINQEPDSLDGLVAAMSVSTLVLRYIGATLTARAPDGTLVPSACESWKASSDGLSWDFVLKQGIKFTNGDSVTARDWAYTFTRLLDPKTKSPNVGFVGQLTKAEAIDDYHLRLTLSEPYFPLLFGLSQGFLQVQSEKAIKAGGDNYGHNPVGAGPYSVKEWKVGDSVTLERNPDFNWGPSYAHKGPWYVQTIIFRFIDEWATITAGLEAGEIDAFWNSLPGKDVQRVKDTGKYVIYEGVLAGGVPCIWVNASRAPFSDVKVRQACNYAIDKESLIAAAVQGFGVPAYGPISPSVQGYWSGVEKIGYKYDEAKAKALLKEAGYTAGTDGILSKDGVRLKVTLTASAAYATPATVVQGMLKKVGVEVVIEQMSFNARIPQLISGDFDFTLSGYAYGEADIMAAWFHSKYIGGNNYMHVNDPDLDKLLDLTRSTIDSAKRQEFVNQVQQMIIERAYGIPLYFATEYTPVNKRVKGAVYSPTTDMLYLDNAYIETK